MATLDEVLTPERTPLLHLHSAADWARLGNGAAPARYEDYEGGDEERAQLARCALIDFSILPRIGFRGPQAENFLASKGYVLPAVPNQAIDQKGGGLIARLSASEFLLLGSLLDEGARVQREEAVWQQTDQACYMLPRQDTHAWLALTGTYAEEVLSKLCGVDLRSGSFAPGAVAQTSVARLNTIIINTSSTALPCFYLLIDSPSACYFWLALLDAMKEFGGNPVSVNVLREHLVA